MKRVELTLENEPCVYVVYDGDDEPTEIFGECVGIKSDEKNNYWYYHFDFEAPDDWEYEI